jgi:hypothetical protein
MLEIEVIGPVTREEADALRIALTGEDGLANVSFAANMSGAKSIIAVGRFTVRQLSKIQELLRRLLEADRIEGLKISEKGVEVKRVSARDLPALQAAVKDFMASVRGTDA